MHKSILIFGASKGIGRATAAHLCAKGWNVYAVARSMDKLESLAKDNPGISIHECDVTNKESLAETIAWAKKERAIDVLLLSVGDDLITDIPSEEISDEAMEKDFKLYVMGTKWLGDEAKKLFHEQGHGALVVIASRAGVNHDALAGRAAYTAGKCGQIGVSQTILEEMREKGINGQVIAVCPGLVPGTDLVKDWQERHPGEDQGTPLPVAVQLLSRVIENPSGHANFLYLLEKGELTEIEPSKHIQAGA